MDREGTEYTSIEGNAVPPGQPGNDENPINIDHVPTEIRLELVPEDPEVIEVLAQHCDGVERNHYALGALRIGILAIRQASSRVDEDKIRLAGDHLLTVLQERFDTHQKTILDRISTSLGDYFDPETGRFPERIKSLIQKDGELESVIESLLTGENSQLVQLLGALLGKDSDLMQHLAPGARGGLIDELRNNLDAQKTTILAEFSLDNMEGALARMLQELERRHGKLRSDLERSLRLVQDDFSLDKPDSALSRLVSRVEGAQKEISTQFSLDQEGSALARMQKELLQVIGDQQKSSQDFHKEVIDTLSGLKAKREESMRSTRHGMEFEAAAQLHIQDRAQRAGDVARPTGNTTGLIRNCKIGDMVVELGPDHCAAGATLVVEAKDRAGYSLPDALTEIEKARQNRGSESGLFVFSSRVAPIGLEPLARYGRDVVVIWDDQDSMTDVILNAGLEIVRALCTKSNLERKSQAADFVAVDRSILEIQKQIDALSDTITFTETIKSSADKIEKRIRIVRKAISRQVEELGERMDDFRSLFANGESSDD